MAKTTTYIKSLTFLMAFLGAVNFGFGQIVAWDFNGNARNEVTVNATTNNANLNTSSISRGSGLEIPPTPPVNTFSADDYNNFGTQGDAITSNDYLQFQVSAINGYQVSLSTLDATFRRSSTGPNAFIWRYSLDGTNFTDIGTTISYLTNPATGTAQTQIILSGIAALQNVVSGTTITFRLYGWGATGSSGTFAIGRLSGNDLSIGGTVAVAPPCTNATTWTSGAWTNGFPTSNTYYVTIDDYYDTGINDGIQTSFSACALSVTPNGTLYIADNTFVEVVNDVIVDGGTIDTQSKGSFVQRGLNTSAGAFSLINSGTAVLNKVTKNYFDSELHYVYWSSPVESADLVTVFANPYLNRRFYYDASLYLDAVAPFDVDDNGDDWQPASGPMEVGHGYVISTTFPIFGTPYSDNYQFSGVFNTGDINVPLYRNDSYTGDTNWNLIGNPYPSAIDAEAFLLHNYYDVTNNPTGTLDGSIYLWTHNTPASNLNPGNEVYNFSQDDYITMNLTGVTFTTTPPLSDPAAIIDGFIPSGQGFFASYANDGASISTNGVITEGAVHFNNDMRMADDTSNNQFFKNANSKSKTSASTNKLWVNLTSDNGVFNQILVGYLNSASNNYDGEAFDATKNLSAGAPAIIFTTIDGCSKKFVIQGKAETSLNENEVIPLGFDTRIDVATIYKLSLAHLQGDFLTGSPIYLKDNLTNTIHDLSTSDYTFTSGVGEFNDRFQIVFKSSTLSTNTFNVDANTVKITQVDETHISFKASNNLNIKTVTIFDLLGRSLYQLKGNQSEEVYNLSNLRNTVFIAKITLSNGVIVTKKAVKQ